MLPKNWDDITLEQYVAINKTLGEQPKDDEANWRLLIKRVSYLTGKDPEWVEDNLTINDLNRMREFLKMDLPTKIIRHFRLNGKRYVVDLDPTKYNAGRYMAVMNQLKDQRPEAIHKVLFQVCREIDWKGKTIDPDLNKLAETIESFKQLPLKIANPIRFFFAMLSENLTNDTLLYLTNQAKTMTKELQEEIDYLNDSAG